MKKLTYALLITALLTGTAFAESEEYSGVAAQVWSIENITDVTTADALVAWFTDSPFESVTSHTKPKEENMITSLFSWMGSFLFWFGYVFIGLIVGTLICRSAFPDVIEKLKLGKTEHYNRYNGKAERFYMILIFVFILWPLTGVFIMLKWGLKLIFFLLTQALMLGVRGIDKAIPKIKIVKDEE